MKVLIIDEDPKTIEAIELCFRLRWRDAVILVATDSEEALKPIEQNTLDLVISEVTLPEDDGIQPWQQIRRSSSVPVILLSSRDSDVDVARGLEAGADDYMTKPFGGAELSARIRAALRRADRLSGNGSRQDPVVTTGYVEIDLGARIVKRRGEEVRLTRTEYDLLRTLATNAGKVLTHRELLQAVWGPEYGDETEYLRTFVKQLRRKLEEDPSRPRYIITEPGIGYRLVQVTT